MLPHNTRHAHLRALYIGPSLYTFINCHHSQLGPGHTYTFLNSFMVFPQLLPPSPLQITSTAYSITLSDKRRFPNYFRVSPSHNASARAFDVIIREYGWQQVAIVSQLNELFVDVSEWISHQNLV